MNFVSDVLGRRDPDTVALIELARDGTRREWTFGQVVDHSAALAATFLACGVQRGDVVMTLIGNRPEWVLSMVASFRIGAVALPCNEQLRAHDLELRIATARPRLIVVDERDTAALTEALQAFPEAERPVVRTVPDPELHDPAALAAPAPAVLAPEDPCLITFTSGTTGEAKGVLHGQEYWAGQAAQAKHWLDARDGDLVWCTAASGWSKSARNVFLAPWLCGATALLHDARFDPEARLDIVDREGVNVLCMAPTEYRVMAKRTELRAVPSLRTLVAAGEALNPEVLHTWRAATGLAIRDGYGQTETGQLTGTAAGVEPKPASMGPAVPGIRLWIEDGELLADPATIPTFFLRYLGEEPPPAGAPWHTGDLVHQDADGWYFFEGRADDVIISAGYRIGPFEVESALLTHPAVADAAVVAAPDDERGSIVRAVVVLRDGSEGTDALVGELQEHVKSVTAPYKYPRVIDFADTLPKTSSGKIQRALLR